MPLQRHNPLHQNIFGLNRRKKMKQKPSMKEMMEKIKARRANPAQVNDDASEIVRPSADDGDDDNQSMAQPADDEKKEIASRPAIATGIKPKKKSKTMKELVAELRKNNERSAMRKAAAEKSKGANQAQEDEQADDGASEIAPPPANDEQQAIDDNCLAEPQPPKKAKISMMTLMQEDIERQERRALARASIEKNKAQQDDQADDGASEIALPPANDELDDKASDKQPLTHAAGHKTREIAHRPAIATGIVPGHKKPYPVHAFGNMAGVVMLIAKSVQVCPEMVGSSLLGVLAALLQAVINVSAKASGTGCPVSLNLFIIASSGERKSSTIDAVAKPVYKAISYATDNRRQMIIQDVTVDGMIVGLIERCASQFLLALEGSSLLGGHAMKAENLGRFLGTVSSLYSGEIISRTRVTGHHYAEDRRLSVTLYTQPLVATGFLSSEMVMQQGLGNRFLYSCPESQVGSRQFDEIELDDAPLYQQYCEKITELANLPWEINPHTEGVQTRTVRMSPGAKAIWVAFYNELERAAGPNGDLAGHAGYVTRYPEQVMRMAALLAMLDDPHAEIISEDVMQRATELGNYYLDSAMDAFNDVPASMDEHNAEILLDWMRSKLNALDIPAIPVRMMYRQGPRCARPNDRTKALLSILESRDDVMQYTKPVPFEGKRSFDNYAVTSM